MKIEVKKVSFEEQYKNRLKQKKQEMTDRLSEIQKARTEVPKSNIEALVLEVKEFYKEQMTKPVEEREIYKEEGEFGRHILLFETDAEILKNKQGLPFNIPQLSSNGQLNVTVPCALLTGEEDVFFKRITLFTPPEQYGWIESKHGGKPLKKNMGIIARGRLTEKYKPIDPEYKGYAIPLVNFLAYMKHQEQYVDLEDLQLEDIDKSEYEIRYTFNQEQLLDVIEL